VRESSTDLLIDLPSDTNVTDLLIAQYRKDPNRPLYAVKQDGRWLDITTRTVLSSVRELAKGLMAQGVRPGDTVAVMSKTRYEWTLADLAIWFAGAVTVPIYETSSAHQVEWILQDSGARVVLVEDESKAAVVRAGAAAAGIEAQLWHMKYDGGGPAPGAGTTGDLTAGNFTALAAAGAGITDDDLETARNSRRLADVASLVYTSGTTGRPKGCEITHANFALVAVNVTEFLAELLLAPNARSLMFLPLAHVLARAVQVICMSAGVKMGHTANAAELLEDLGTYQPTFLLAVPRIFEKIFAGAQQKAQAGGKAKLFDAAVDTAVSYSRAVDARNRGTGRGPGPLLQAKRALFNKLLYPKLRAVFGGELDYAVSGASGLSAHLAHFFRGAGVNVLQGYGLTETTAPASVETPDLVHVGSVGIPVPGTAIRIEDDGEVLIKGIGVFAGYHNNPQANETAFTDGFFHTGDLGELDEDGFLTITGRKKDLLVTAGGKNVAPEPLEEKVREHPLVSQAVVVGEGRPFVSALVTLDSEALASWASVRQLPALSPAEACTDARILGELQQAIDGANATVSRAEQIRKFVVLERDFTLESGHMTPTLKLKRNVVIEDFAADVEKLYAK
jgi:long-chain acyl-CoA synthetase